MRNWIFKRVAWPIVVTMSDWDPVAAIEPPAVEVKLFGRWNPDEVQVSDISLQVSPELSLVCPTSVVWVWAKDEAPIAPI